MIQIINMSPPGKAKSGAKGKGKTLTSRKTRKTVIHPTEKKPEKKKMTNTEKKKPIQKKQPTKKGSKKKPTRKQRTPSHTTLIWKWLGLSKLTTNSGSHRGGWLVAYQTL